ncbi:HupE/UreJ family protein [Candidatus Methylocalor cossyra]|uniref:HupE / UreJ protein n=1 Tax=Candidatus Methylocalor cossyra TaxID=3108543 RepID=A0ABM9NL68_9GAMM
MNGPLWLGCLLALLAWDAVAHKPSDSYLQLTVAGAEITGQWDIALRDLDYALGLDTDDDGAITWGELKSRRAELSGYALARLRVQADAGDCPLSPAGLAVDHHTDGAYAVLILNGRCSAVPRELVVDYRLLFDLDPQHRGLLRLVAATGTRTAVFAPASARQSFPLASPDAAWPALLHYGQEGIWHIWLGYDHLLFLLSLLLPAVLVRDSGRWRPAARFPPAALEAARLVTAFTLAHSLTLSLAALGYVALPARWVESAIAASVLVAAVNNVVPVLLGWRVALAFLFGLVHGLGFASVLLDLALPAQLRLLGLLGFNLGVEVGQLAVVAAFLPLAYALCRSRLYQPLALRLGSAAIAALACLWLAERSLGLSW